MNFIKLLNAATQGQSRRLRPMIVWTVLEYAFRGAPYGFMLLVIWEIFKPLEMPGTPLNIERIIWICTGLAVSAIGLFFFSYKSYMSAYADGYDICAKGRISIAQHLRKLSMGFYNSKDPGDIGAYLVNDYTNIETLVTHLLPQLVGGLTMSLVLITSLLFFNFTLAMAAVAVIPLAIPAAWVSGRLVQWAGRKQQKSRNTAIARMLEYIQGIKLVKAFNIGGEKFDRLEKAFRKLKKDQIRLEGGTGPTFVFSSFILSSGLIIIILIGFSMLLGAKISIPVYILFLIIGARVYEPLIQALMFLGLLNYMKLGVERIENLRKTPELADGENTSPIEYFNIEFSGVCFSYNNVEVLKELNFKLPANSLTALVGPSGSGKTTVTRLIARFWDVQKGDIRINNNNIKDYPVDMLLSNISMVFQDVYLFNDTIYNNIRLGRENATDAEIIEAARKARCHDFIETLPEKYRTMVGEGGSTLSGGEKQRISIARAILKNAPVVLLDEATASLDPENELHIQQAINDLVKNKTVVVIAHRLNTIINADNIIVLDRGQLTESGTHKELLSANGLYRKMWDEQQQLKGWKF